MKIKRLSSLLSIAVIVGLMLSLFNTVNVFADDETPPAPATEEPAQSSEDESAPETDSAPDATEEPVDESGSESTPEADSASTPQPTSDESSDENNEPQTPAEVLESAPEGTDIVVLDENGEAMMLTTEAAAQVIVNGDPMWCPDGVSPGGPGCTIAHPSFTDLVADLVSGGYAGNGTIYVAHDYALSEGQIVLDHTNGSLADLDNLTIQGGWDFGSNTMRNNDDTFQSTLDGTWLYIHNWDGNVTVNNIFIDNSTARGLEVDTEGDVELNYVTVEHADEEGAIIFADGDVTVNDSTFNHNGEFGYSGPGYSYGATGLEINKYGDGNVTLNNVTANENSFNGVRIYSEGSVDVDGGEFINNGWEGENFDYDNTGASFEYGFSTTSGNGLDVIYSYGDITLAYVLAGRNAGHGASLFSEYGEINVTTSAFDNNGWLGDYSVETSYDDLSGVTNFTLMSNAGSGLVARTGYGGDITLFGVQAISNGGNGAELLAINSDSGQPNGDIEVMYSLFVDNGWSYGLFDEEFCGSVCLEIFFDEFLYDNADDDAFCELQPLYFTFVFDPCSDSDYIEVQGPNFYYNVTTDIDGLSRTDSYLINQWGGTGLTAEGKDVTLVVYVVGNSSIGADINATGTVGVFDSGFVDNGYLGSLWFNESLSYNGISYAEYELGLEYRNGDGAEIYADGDVSLINFSADINAGNGISAQSNNGSILVDDAELIGNGDFVPIGGEFGLFGEFLYDMLGLDFTLELPVSGFQFDLLVGLPGLSIDMIDLYAGAFSGSGLNAAAYGGDVTLMSVYAEDNLGFGANVYADGNIDITDSEFYDNGTGFFLGLGVYLSDDYIQFGGGITNGSGLYAEAGNDITLSDVLAKRNALYGAELYSGAVNSVFVENSVFEDNGYGGSFLPTGIRLEGFYYEDINGSDSDFSERYGSGLYIDSAGNVTLIEVEANNNYQDGAEVYSNGGRVIVSCGTYNNNGDYGIYEDGAASLELYGPEILNNGNSPDEYFFSNSVILSDDCIIPVATVTGSSGGSIGSCDDGQANLFLVRDDGNEPNGDFVIFPCPIVDTASVGFVAEDKLPGELPDFKPDEDGGEAIYRSALRTELIRNGESMGVNEGAILVSFLIPDGVDQETLSILFWDGGNWVDLGGFVSEIGPDGQVEEGKLYLKTATFKLGSFVLVTK